MASVTTWTRLEPDPRQAAMEETLKARIYDPLWMLARQWQLGEFQGEDNGSPVTVSLQGESSQLTRFAPGPLARTSPLVTASPPTAVDAPRPSPNPPLTPTTFNCVWAWPPCSAAARPTPLPLPKVVTLLVAALPGPLATDCE